MEASPTAASVMNARVQPVKADSSPMEPVQSLKEHGVAVLVDEEHRPVSILTRCDIDQVLGSAGRIRNQNRKAEALFPNQGPTYVHTVRVDDNLDAVAAKILDKQLDTGIVVVDSKGAYAGYVFASDLRTRMQESVRQRVSDLRSSAASLQSRHPNINVDIDKLLGRRSDT